MIINFGFLKRLGFWFFCFFSFQLYAATDFQPLIFYKTGLQSVGIAEGDFDTSGNLSLAVTNFYDSTVSIFLSNGDGTFQCRPEDLVAGDFKKNQKLALAITTGNDNTLSLLYQTIVQ